MTYYQRPRWKLWIPKVSITRAPSVRLRKRRFTFFRRLYDLGSQPIGMDFTPKKTLILARTVDLSKDL